LPSLPGAGRRTWPKPKAKAKAAAAVTDALDDGIAADVEQRWELLGALGFTKGRVLNKTLLLTELTARQNCYCFKG